MTKSSGTGRKWKFVSRTSEERREHERYPFNAEILIRTPVSDAAIQARTGDICQTGCSVENDLPLPVDSVVKIRIFTLSRTFEAEARVVHVGEGKGVALEFTAVNPQEIATLRDWLTMVIADGRFDRFAVRG
ncbi:MAG TPA: PilZ domain-containing protein [Candidatus Acidoferrales bacterium]|nr:PilZ domain-containing protein [Candidatus Acidoferrales bacterium]